MKFMVTHRQLKSREPLQFADYGHVQLVEAKNRSAARQKVEDSLPDAPYGYALEVELADSRKPTAEQIEQFEEISGWLSVNFADGSLADVELSLSGLHEIVDEVSGSTTTVTRAVRKEDGYEVETRVYEPRISKYTLTGNQGAMTPFQLRKSPGEKSCVDPRGGTSA